MYYLPIKGKKEKKDHYSARMGSKKLLSVLIDIIMLAKTSSQFQWFHRSVALYAKSSVVKIWVEIARLVPASAWNLHSIYVITEKSKNVHELCYKY